MQLNKEKQNNIETFEKHKSNAVGEASLGDPKEKHKFVNKITSNNQTSNIKFPTSNSAITLIALIITILFSYDEMIKFSNSKGFLLATIK